MHSVTLLLPPWSVGFAKKLEVKRKTSPGLGLPAGLCCCPHANVGMPCYSSWHPGDTGVGAVGSQSRDVQKGFQEGSLSMNSGEFQEASRRAGVAGTARLH